jgi:hypothetical protein
MEGSLLDHSTNVGAHQLAAVDQAICAQAKLFVGTLGSGFSSEIHFERRRRHEAGETSSAPSLLLKRAGELGEVNVGDDWPLLGA